MLQRLTRAIITVIVIFSSIAISRAVVQSLIPPSKPTPEDFKGLVVSKSIFTNNCTREAVDAANITREQQAAYCGCVYDTGIGKYGGEQFTKMMYELEQTKTFTPEDNELFNVCIERTLQ